MNITNDIHTKILVPICVVGFILAGNYFYQTSIANNWLHTEKLPLVSYAIIVFFLALPIYAALFRHHGKGLSEFEPAPEDIAKMGSFRQKLNSPKGIESIYMSMMYPIPIGMCFYLLKGFVE